MTARFSLSRSIGIAAGFVFALQMTVPAAADLAAAEAAIAAKDYESAIAELQPLAGNGDGYATWKLAQLYLDGHGGSPEEGVTLLQQAATAGEPEAQARLGVMYAKGNGVQQSDVEAYKWLSLAARGAAPGVSRTVAQTNQTIVAQRMSADQRAQAQAESDTVSAAYQAPAPAATTEPAASEPAVSEPVAVEPAPSATPMTGFRIQLASVPKEGDVAGEWTRLKKRIGAPLDGLELHVEEADLGGTKGIYHRLQAGPFASRDEAVNACQSVKAAGGDCLVVAP